MTDDQPTPSRGPDHSPIVVVQHGRDRPVARAVELVRRVTTPPRTVGIGGVALGFGILILIGTAQDEDPKA